ncbi:MAG: hypothetical protein HZB55_17095 [Deltaproteobacteria bacterium]|nr:hypothetical protein [Deltaproteobacteria bacterium]
MAPPVHYSGWSQTPTWMDVVGKISVNGAPAGAGVEIAVRNSQGLLCGASGVDASVAAGGAFVLHVYGDDTSTPAVDGARANEVLTFEVWVPSLSVVTPQAALTFSNGQFGTPPPTLPPVYADGQSYGMDVAADLNPPVVAISAPADGSLTNDTTPMLTFDAGDGVSVVVKVDNVVVAKTSGQSLDTLADGSHTVVVESTDTAGNRGTASSTFTVDTTAPVASISAPADGSITNDSAPTLIFGSGDGVTVVVKVDGAVVAKTSGQNLDVLGDGSHTVTVESTDAAGNKGTASSTFTVDTLAPTVAITSPANGALTNDNTPALVFNKGDGVSVVVKVDNVVVAKTSGQSLDTLTEGSHTVVVESTDAAGNKGTATSTFTVDTVAPTVSISAPATGSATNDNTPLLTFNPGDGTTVVVKVDSSVVPKTSGQSLDTLADGSHTVVVESTDGAGNTGTATSSFTVDTVAPTVSITAPATGSATTDNTPLLTFNPGDGTTVVVKVDTVVVAKTSGQSLDSLTDGSHTVTVESSDAAGNTGTASSTFTVDTVAPIVSISAPANGSATNDSTPLLTFNPGDGTTVVVKVDNVVVAKTSGQSLDTLTDGPHTVVVESTDAAGNKGTASSTFTVDTVVPVVSISSPSNGSSTNNTTPLLTYNAGGGVTVVVKLDNAVIAKTSGNLLDALTDGTYTVTVESTDAAGNTGTASSTFTINTHAPAVSISAPLNGSRTNDPTPTLTFDKGTGVTVVVKVDNVVVAKNSGDSLNTLADGSHTVTVESTDAASNTGTATSTFTVDTTAPAVSISAPANGSATSDNTPLLTYNAGDGTVVVVKLDTVVVAKTSGESLDTLADGSHTVLVESTDDVGNKGTASSTFTVDTVTHVTVGTATPSTKGVSYTLTGTAETGAAVVVTVDTAASVGTVSRPTPTTWSCTLSSLVLGANGVTVEATDAVGNKATATATVTRLPNHAPVLTVPATQTVNENVALRFSVTATDADSDAVTITAGTLPTGASFASGELTWTPTYLQAGSYTVSFTGSDGFLSDAKAVTITVTDVPQNPVAVAGPDQTVFEGVSVTLDGSNSHDVDGTVQSYEWVQTLGPAAELSSYTVANPTFTTPAVVPAGAALEFELTVTDDKGLKGTDRVVINVSNVNVPPTADAGPDQTVNEGSIVTLDASNSTDSDGTIATYAWVQKAGPAVTLTDAGAETATFTASEVDTQTASLTFELTVTDDGGLMDTDTVVVNISNVNKAPTAAAGDDQAVDEGAVVTLDGTQSADADGTISAYLWTQTAGPTVTLSDPTAAVPTFDAPSVTPAGVSLTFELSVTDNEGLKGTDSVVVNITDVNVPPTAEAGPDQRVAANKPVTLDGSGCDDADGTIVAYQWKQTGGPAVTLSDPTAMNPTFDAPATASELEFELTVTDDCGLQRTDTMKVTVAKDDGGGNNGLVSKCFITAAADPSDAGRGALIAVIAAGLVLALRRRRER